MKPIKIKSTDKVNPDLVEIRHSITIKKDALTPISEMEWLQKSWDERYLYDDPPTHFRIVDSANGEQMIEFYKMKSVAVT